jgi:hypothetical protein
MANRDAGTAVGEAFGGNDFAGTFIGSKGTDAPRGARSAAAVRAFAGAKRCEQKFLRFFPRGFADETYVDWERGYKWTAHQRWAELLNKAEFKKLLRQREYEEVAARAVKIESRTNLLFSFEKMALRDAVRPQSGARAFSQGLYQFLYGKGSGKEKFERWCEVVGALPRKQTRVLTWPVVTIFGFIAQPEIHMFLKPNVTRKAAQEYGFDFNYQSRPNWETYRNFLDFGAVIRGNLRKIKPRDMIDLQSFMWVQGSSEYEE